MYKEIIHHASVKYKLTTMHQESTTMTLQQLLIWSGQTITDSARSLRYWGGRTARLA